MMKIKHVIGKNSIYPMVKATEPVHALYHDLYIGGPPKPHVAISWPRFVSSPYNFYGATTMINGSLFFENLRV